MRGAGTTSRFRVVEVHAASARIVLRIGHDVMNEQTVIAVGGFILSLVSNVLISSICLQSCWGKRRQEHLYS